ncbi:ABC-F family ATP-binding cassette domain-containing protein [Deferribacter autotrophicus]|uniref:ABC-F family ATP-binding cassette domain-containing protein n=1 Tax=Deferribacter autotrophicus TaxID=500465 RepID=A0A5A8F4L3_9BACT|nr:ABC-F family ATP-binding cassette domain-containing protein [Deferribacter autotrophicus]KAA0258334.1 ABC-F family ATP-binding cassette domain-containing protein [Deferribacter autotrophicus]
MISVENLSKTFGDKVLFDSISFTIGSGEKVGLVGRNGEGKTTLFRIITGEEEPDTGRVNIPKNYKIGYLKQHLEFTKSNLLDEVYSEVESNLEDNRWKAEKVLFGLGFTKEDLQKNPHDFSGGYQVRINLAKVLVADSDMLLLDEPTNYLDILSIRWLARFLKEWRKEFILITHDRGFMDEVCTHILGIHRKKVRKIKGNTEKYYQQVALDDELYEKTRQNVEKRKKEIEQFISKFRAKARQANLVQSRLKTLEKLEGIEQLEEIKNLKFRFSYKPFEGKNLMHVKDISFGYSEDKILFQNLSFTVGSKDRICIVGPNGKGKTTLIKVLSGKLKPLQGEIVVNNGVELGVYEQSNISSLVDNRSIEEEIMYSAPEVDRQRARDIAGIMMFGGDDALKKISVLSGGEKSRVMLGKVIAKSVNLLMLDEPTNHLDIYSTDALLEALLKFEGAVLMVTHNETFLREVANRLIVFKKDAVFLFEGTYDEFLEKIGWDEEDFERDRKEEKNKLSKKDIRRLKAELIAEKSKVLNPLAREVEELEKAIEESESRKEELNSLILKYSVEGNFEEIASLSKELKNLEKNIDELYSRYEIKLSELEEKEIYFQKKLEQLI